ncbi:MAG: hypothetical protein HC903_30550 [Methylacidiphilales bacterium]|nr:hypothetical protein [Candidatus Methylacidiphilales bacterium]
MPKDFQDNFWLKIRNEEPSWRRKVFSVSHSDVEKFSFFLIERWVSSANTGKLASWFDSLGAGINIEFLAILSVTLDTHAKILTASHSKQIILKE